MQEISFFGYMYFIFIGFVVVVAGLVIIEFLDRKFFNPFSQKIKEIELMKLSLDRLREIKVDDYGTAYQLDKEINTLSNLVKSLEK